MGKRELLLIVAFVILGGIVYQATAPPAAPGEQGFSLSRMLDHVRREVRGNRASAQHTSTAVKAVDTAVTELRITVRSGPLTVVGESRTDVSAELVATSTGFDEAEAQRLVKETAVTFDQAGSVLFLSVHFPEAATQRVRNLSIKVPSRLIVRMVEANSGKLEISKVAGVELGQARGETNIRQITGRVTALHRGGDLLISDAGSVKLTTRGSDVTIAGIRGDAALNVQAGELKTSDIAGSIELESNSTDVVLDALDRTTGAVNVNASGGTVDLRGLRSEGRIDARNAEVEVVLGRAAAIGIYSEGGEPVQVTLPPDGFRLDAITREGGIRTTPEDLAARLGLEVARGADGREEKMVGSVQGGGPLVTLRTRGPITFAAPGTTQPKPEAEARQKPDGESRF